MNMSSKAVLLNRRSLFCSFIFVIIFISYSFLLLMQNEPKLKEEAFEDILNDDFFTTVLGSKNIAEIEKNVFEKFGYELIKNDLIPILKKSNSQTCQNVFLEWQKVANKGLTIDPPKEIPDPKAFLLNGYAKKYEYYFNEVPKNEKETITIWNQTFIDSQIKAVRRNSSSIFLPYYDESLAVNAATKHYNIKGQRGAVIGSQSPWVEIYALANGAKHVTTVDYLKISIQHPQMDFLYVLDLAAQSEKYYNKFDFIVSFSSIEHSGLGRYGDPMDPIGDIREMMKIHCMLKPNGLLFVGFPVGADAIVYNAHRIYGRIRSAMMFEGFRVLNVFHSDIILQNEVVRETFSNNTGLLIQYLFVLQKIET